MEKIIFYVIFHATGSAQQYPAFYQSQMQSYEHYNEMPLDNIRVYEDYASSECSCFCQTCDNIQPCCRSTCINCFQPTPSNIVLVPYPYPVIISTKQKELTTIETTTENATTKPTLETTELRNDAYMKEIMARAPNLNKKSKFVLTNLRRTKTDWMPKYGIVPLPDNLAEKLMLQLRNMRVLHPKKETYKPTESMTSLEKL